MACLISGRSRRRTDQGARTIDQALMYFAAMSGIGSKSGRRRVKHQFAQARNVRTAITAANVWKTLLSTETDMRTLTLGKMTSAVLAAVIVGGLAGSALA